MDEIDEVVTNRDWLRMRLELMESDLPMVTSSMFRVMGEFMEAGFGPEDSMAFAKQTYERLMGDWSI